MQVELDVSQTHVSVRYHRERVLAYLGGFKALLLDVQEKIDDAINRIVAAGRTAGTLAMDGNVAHFARMGVKFFFTSTAPWIMAGAKDFINKAQQGAG